MLCYNKLCNTFTILYSKWHITKVYQNYTDFTPIISIHSARTIQHSYAMFQSQTTTRTHLGFIPHRQSHIKASRYQLTTKRFQYNIFVDISPYIQSGRLRGCILWHRMPGFVYDRNFQFFHTAILFCLDNF